MNKFIIVNRSLSFLEREWKTSKGASTRGTFLINTYFSRLNKKLGIAPYLTYVFSNILLFFLSSSILLSFSSNIRKNKKKIPYLEILYINIYKSSLYKLALKVRQSPEIGKRLDFSRYDQLQGAFDRHWGKSLKPLLRVSFRCLGVGDLVAPRGPVQK